MNDDATETRTDIARKAAFGAVKSTDGLYAPGFDREERISIAMLSAARVLADFDGIDGLASRVYGRARWDILDAHRRVMRRRDLAPMTEFTETTATVAPIDADALDLVATLNELGEAGEIVRRVDVEGEGLAEAATDLGLSRHQAARLRAKALKRLKKKLGEGEG